MGARYRELFRRQFSNSDLVRTVGRRMRCNSRIYASSLVPDERKVLSGVTYRRPKYRSRIKLRMRAPNTLAVKDVRIHLLAIIPRDSLGNAWYIILIPPIYSMRYKSPRRASRVFADFPRRGKRRIRSREA